jgi:hypothetical protein
MIMTPTRRAAVVGLALTACPLRGSTEPAAKQTQEEGEFVELERPVVFEVTSRTGSLKETTQAGQELIWHQKGKSIDRRFQLTNISIAFLRSETGGTIKMTFSCNVSSSGYRVEEVKLNVTVRSRGGGAIYAWSFDVAVKCDDKNQPLTPLTQEVPNDVAANVFNNVNTIEVAEYTGPGFPGVRVHSCG